MQSHGPPAHALRRVGAKAERSDCDQRWCKQSVSENLLFYDINTFGFIEDLNSDSKCVDVILNFVHVCELPWLLMSYKSGNAASDQAFLSYTYKIPILRCHDVRANGKGNIDGLGAVTHKLYKKYVCKPPPHGLGTLAADLEEVSEVFVRIKLRSHFQDRSLQRNHVVVQIQLLQWAQKRKQFSYMFQFSVGICP